MSATFDHPSLFQRATLQTQLMELSQFVLASVNPTSSDIDRFESRLSMYAGKAEISLEQARENVRITSLNAVGSVLTAYGLT